MRTILALMAVEDMHLESIDISSAFLHSMIDMELYMKFPEDFPENVPPSIHRKPGKDGACAKLEKGIYGLCQGTNLWNKCLHQVLVMIGFFHITLDPYVYVYLRDNICIIISIYVDDMTLASKSHAAILKVISKLHKHFKLCHLGSTSGLLGVVVIHDQA